MISTRRNPLRNNTTTDKKVVYRIDNNSPINIQVNRIMNRLRHINFITLSAINNSIEKLIEILHTIENKRFARIIHYRTSTIRSRRTREEKDERDSPRGRDYEEDFKLIPRLMVDIRLNIDIRFESVMNFTHIFRKMFLPRLIEKNPDFETEEAFDRSKEKEMLVPISEVEKLKFSNRIDPEHIRRGKNSLKIFEKVQKDRKRRGDKSTRKENRLEVKGVFVDRESVVGFMNKYELLSYLTLVMTETSLKEGENMTELLKETFRE